LEYLHNAERLVGAWCGFCTAEPLWHLIHVLRPSVAAFFFCMRLARSSRLRKPVDWTLHWRPRRRFPLLSLSCSRIFCAHEEAGSACAWCAVSDGLRICRRSKDLHKLHSKWLHDNLRHYKHALKMIIYYWYSRTTICWWFHSKWHDLEPWWPNKHLSLSKLLISTSLPMYSIPGFWPPFLCIDDFSLIWFSCVKNHALSPGWRQSLLS
jgi:hypothetical protein